MINMPIDSSLKSESIDLSYMVLIKKIKKCEANSEFSELKNFCSELLTLKTLNLNNSEYTSHGLNYILNMTIYTAFILKKNKIKIK